MSKHTPGPWVVHANLSGDESHRGYRVAPIEKHNRSWLLAQVMPLDSNGIAGGANARLIASAPELLEALLMVRDADNDCLTDGLPTIPSMARAKIDAAIKKAEGA